MSADIATSTVLAAMTQAMTDLGPTAEDVATRMRALEIKGRIGAAGACPLARYLQQTVPGAGETKVGSSFAWPYRDHSARVELTEAAKRFRLNFDRAVYLDLVDQDAAGPPSYGGWQEQIEGGVA